MSVRHAQCNAPGASLEHPAFDAIRHWYRRLEIPSLEALNALAEQASLVTESGRPVRFVPPSRSDRYYEIHLYETGEVHTRAQNWHDLFNALVWLSFPRSKARINALHAATIPGEGGTRGPLRDLLTIFDEGGAIRTPARIYIFGHAVMEKALAPFPGITCKVLSVELETDIDAQVAAALSALAPHGTPKSLPTQAIFREQHWVQA